MLIVTNVLIGIVIVVLFLILDRLGDMYYTNELEDADLEKFDYEYLGYCDRNDLERVIS